MVLKFITSEKELEIIGKKNEAMVFITLDVTNKGQRSLTAEKKIKKPLSLTGPM